MGIFNVNIVFEMLIQAVGKGIMDDQIMKGIIEVQKHFMQVPDGFISVNRTAHKFLNH
jgi:hypothetical protein